MIKKAFNAMLNANKPIKNAPNGIKLKEFGLKWPQVSDAVLTSHGAIAHHFYTGAGLRLQKVDSQIAEKVLLHFAKRGLPILPLHDSFLMHHAFEEQLPNAMRKAFQEIGLGEAKVDEKINESRKNAVNIEDLDPHSKGVVADVMDLLEDYPDYMHREDAFRNIRHLVS